MARTRFQIGEWWADPATNELGRGGETVRIEPKAMEVLVLLAGRAGRVVTREELFSAVWPGVVVGDEAITQSVIKLRRALGDNPRDPSYIETISKRGYRLIASVQQDVSAPLAPGQAASGMPRPPPAHGRHRVVLVGGVVMAVLGAAYFVQSNPKPAVDIEFGDRGQSAPITVTVLPFESSGGEGEQAYLARGISNDLTTDLSRHPGLRLIEAAGPGTASPSAPGARYVVSGSVQRLSDTLRINIRLIDARTKEQLWSARFERPFDDLFTVQDEIIRKLTDVLPGQLSDAARERLAKRYTRSLEAYDHFLRGQALFLARQSQQNDEARDSYRKALALDPKFARAFAGLAMTYAIDFRLRESGDRDTALTRAFELAETARLIDPDIPEVHWALGFVHAQNRRHVEALRSLRRAIELNRSFADGYALMGGIYTYVGEPAKAIPLLRTAIQLNPDGGYLYFLVLGRAYLFENDPEQALIHLRAAVMRNPADLETRVFLAAAMVAAGNVGAAEWEAEEIRTLAGGFELRRWLQTYPLTNARHTEKLVGLLAQAGL
jgi:DNA-binding winged helix-turn-helix (wHTH) protein/TolB-like protein/Tfp pilus assembly protein PilF